MRNVKSEFDQKSLLERIKNHAISSVLHLNRDQVPSKDIKNEFFPIEHLIWSDGMQRTSHSRVSCITYKFNLMYTCIPH